MKGVKSFGKKRTFVLMIKTLLERFRLGALELTVKFKVGNFFVYRKWEGKKIKLRNKLHWKRTSLGTVYLQRLCYSAESCFPFLFGAIKGG